MTDIEIRRIAERFRRSARGELLELCDWVIARSQQALTAPEIAAHKPKRDRAAYMRDYRKRAV